MGATTLIGGALSLGSAVANSIAQNKVDAARQRAIDDNNAKQAGFDRQIASVQADALHPYGTFGATNAGNASALASMFNSGNIGTATGATAPTGALPASSNTAVRAEDAKQAGKAAAFASQQGTALGAMNATGQTLQDANLNRARDTSQQATLQGFKTGQQNVLPYQLDAANQSANGLKFFGDLLHGAGQVGILAGMGGGGAFGSPAAAVGAPLNILQPAATAPAIGGIGSDYVASLKAKKARNGALAGPVNLSSLF